MAHNFRPKSQWFFFAYVKMPKICKLQDAQKCRPRAEFGIWQYGSSSFYGRIKFWAFQVAILTGKAIFSAFPVAPPIIVSEILEISKMIIGGATGKVLKRVFPANLASWKAQNLIVPWKLDDPSCQIENSARGQRFWAYWKLHIFHRKKKSQSLGSEIMCHCTLRVLYTQFLRVSKSYVVNFKPQKFQQKETNFYSLG